MYVHATAIRRVANVVKRRPSVAKVAACAQTPVAVGMLVRRGMRVVLSIMDGTSARKKTTAATLRTVSCQTTRRQAGEG